MGTFVVLISDGSGGFQKMEMLYTAQQTLLYLLKSHAIDGFSTTSKDCVTRTSFLTVS